MEGRTEVPAEFLGDSHQPSATERQLNYLFNLARERDIPEDARAELLDRIERKDITKKRASDFIERLQSKPKRAGHVGRVTVTYEDLELDNGDTRRIGRLTVPDCENHVLAGRYAVDTPGEGWANDTSFFKVWVGDRNGWGVELQASDDFHDIAFPRQLEALKLIAVDPAAASARWGREFERCGVCGRGLTNDESRELGIGPVCRTRLA